MPLLSQIFASELCTSWRSYNNGHGVHVFTWRCVAYRWTIGVSNMFWKTINGQCWFLLYRTTSGILGISHGNRAQQHHEHRSLHTKRCRTCSATLRFIVAIWQQKNSRKRGEFPEKKLWSFDLLIRLVLWQGNEIFSSRDLWSEPYRVKHRFRSKIFGYIDKKVILSSYQPP